MNGCHNREPFKAEMTVQDGWNNRIADIYHHEPRRPVMVDVPFRMAPDCRYTHTELGQADKGCDGCRWKVEGKRNG